jgi:hypothetical protein
MRWADWLDRWNMRQLSIRLPFLELQWAPGDADREAAWDMYVEMLTRVTTQALPDGEGVEKAALASVQSLFATTRDVLRRHGRGAGEFMRLAIVVLNQVIRPFTTKWHLLAQAGAFDDPAQCAAFRREVEVLRLQLIDYTRALADMAGVEDLTGV